MTTATTFEDEVRAMLARRAADIPERADGLAPPLPAGLRIPVDAVDSGAPRRPGARFAVAAALLLLLGGLAGVVVATGGDVSTERTDAPASTVPARPLHLSSFPGGVDPTVGPVRGVGPVADSPEAARTAVLAPAFGEEVSPPAPFVGDGTAPGDPELWASWYTPMGAVDPSIWSVDDATRAGVGGSVTVRRAEGGWQAVAVTSEAIDLTDLTHDGERLTGEVRVDVGAPVRVVLSTLDGRELATVGAIRTGDATPSVVYLDGLDVDLANEPVVLRVEAGDRPGQVGIDGVGVAAFAAVAVTPGADPAAVAPTTTEAEVPVVPDERGASLPPGPGALWRAPVERWGEDVGGAALAFAAEAMGVADATLVSAPSPAPPGEDVIVELRLVSEVVVPIVLRRDGGDWSVLRIDEGTVEVDRGGDGIGYGFGGPAAELEVPRSDRVTVVRPDGTTERYDGDTPADLDRAAGWIVTEVDEDGRVLAATGNPS